jgi:hypothetical protein
MKTQVKLLMTAAVTVLAMHSVACSLQIESTLALEDGSAMELEIPSGSPNVVSVPIEGGTVMGIDVGIGLLDLLFGSIEGDVSVVELLFASTGFSILGVDTQELCVIPDPVDAGGGTFTADLFHSTASFDVTINTRGVVGNPVLAAAFPDGFPFPFALQSEVPMTLGEMLGLLTGSGSLSIEQELDDELLLMVGALEIPIHLGGTLTLASADAFPTSALLDTCLDIVSP